MADSVFFERMNQGCLGQTGAGGQASSMPLINTILGLSDAKGPLEALSTQGFGTKDVDAFGLFKDTKLARLWKSGAPTGQGSTAGIDPSMPANSGTFASAVSSSRGDSEELGR